MEDFVPFELAKKLKEKGFPQDIQHCIGWYPTEYYKNSWIGEYFEGELQEIEDYYGDRISAIHIIENENKGVVAPTISQVLKWLREEKKIFVITFIADDSDAPLTYEVYRNTECLLTHHGNYFTLQEWDKCTLAGIEYCLDNLI